MTILSKLVIVPMPRTTVADPAFKRRKKFIKQLEQQRELAREQDFEATKRKWVVQADGSKRLIVVPKRVKRWWRVDAQGACFLVLRYGNKIITLTAGRTAIAVGSKNKLVSTIDTVIAAVKAGEFDAALAATLDGSGIRNSHRKKQNASRSKLTARQEGKACGRDVKGR